MPITSRMFGDRGRRRAAGLGIDPERLPPGQSPTVKWPVLSVEAPPPMVDTANWRLAVDGAVEAPYELDWESFRSAPQSDWTGDIHCVTRWSKFNMRWRGVGVAELLSRARLRPGAGFLLAHCHGGYTTNMPLSDVLTRPALIAHQVDGAALARDHGGPARLLVPHLYLWKSAKWIQRLEVLEDDQLGFWEQNGYHHRGDPWKEERYSVDDYVARTLRRQVRGRTSQR